MNPPRRPAPHTGPAHARETSSDAPTAGPSGAPREPQPGEMVGPYRVVRELGRGGMAVVYETEEIDLKRRVALKVLVGAAAADPQGRLRFVREAQAQAKINHEHVVTIFRVGEDRGLSYIAMPVLGGQSLAQALDATPRPPVAQAVRIGSEIAEGLAAAHAVGLVHRDIKPSNIWLEAPKWRVKILDFGLARSPHGDGASDITIQGQVVGTPAYMSPEQAAGRAVDHRTDLWSLGVVLYQMVAGAKPFVGDTTLNLMTEIVSADPPAPVDLAPDVPPALSDLIMRLLAKHPAHRPATADDVVAELGAVGRSMNAPWAAGHPVTSSTAVAPVVVPAPVPSAADPWSGIEATEASAPRPVREPEKPRRSNRRDDDDDERPRRRGRRDEDEKPRSLVWLWAVCGVAGAVVLGGLVWMAVDAVSPKPKPTEPTAEKPKEPPKPAPPPRPESDRAAAEALLPGAKLRVQVDGRAPVDVPAGGALPAGKLSILEIDFESNEAVGPFYVTGTLLPALTHLRSLTRLRMRRYQMTLAPEHLRQMAAMPLAGTLIRLDAQVELTPASFADLRKLTALKDLTLNVPKPDDALFARLPELAQLELLTFFDLSPAAGLTGRGWDAVAQMPLALLTLVESRAAPAALRALTARRPGAAPPALEFVNCEELTDEHLRELSERPTDVRILSLSGSAISDAGLVHLAEVKSLRTVSVQRSRATEAGARALYAARPDLKLYYNDKLIDKKN